ncbi:zinc finger MYND domain-containing protein 15 [Pleurodeles waltl]|uniref:zinc finger MYND domain-containing protein 15 n=1 Tax=Pleurodeles waltl TaxID=8319 RepID=UPI003709C087
MNPHQQVPQAMEFVTGYREAILDFSELLFSWYRKYLMDHVETREEEADEKQQKLEATIKKLPVDQAQWVVHILRNHSLSFRVKNPDQQIQDKFYNEEALSLEDLDKFISFVSLTGDEQEEDCEGEQEEEEDLLHLDYFLLVTDDSGTVMGIDFIFGCNCQCPKKMMLTHRAFDLLCYSMAFPMAAGEPHRPKQVTTGDIAVHRLLDELVSQLGVKMAKNPMRSWSQRPNFTFPAMRVKGCHVCKRRSFETQLTPCTRCKAVLYCSERCRKIDWKKSPEDVSHQYWCDKMRGYMSHALELADFPFKYTAEVTSDTFDKEMFLASRELNSGYWAKESMNDAGVRHGQEKRSWFPQQKTGPYHPLKKEGEILLGSFPAETATAKAPHVTWKEYYQWRALDLDSPVAALLTYPLTIYHIITHLAPQHFPELNILNKQSLKIHIIEAHKELDLIMVFWELSILLPHVALELHFVGDGLPQEVDEEHFVLQRKGSGVVRATPSFTVKEKGDKKRVQVKVYSRPYHSLQGPKPDIVIGFNSGFGLKDTWLSSLPRLQSLRVPAYFTECSEYSCAIDEQIMGIATGGTMSKAAVNPFRSPFRIVGIDNCMPWYPNAFVFHLIYKSMANNSRFQGQHQPQPPPAPAAAVLEEPPDHSRRKKEKRQSRNNCRRRK